MQYAHTLDIRDLAQDWRELQAGIDEMDRAEWYEYLEETEKYRNLCSELGIRIYAPDALEAYGEGFEPKLISERDFTLYAQELADELGAVPDNAQWPMTCIDWEQAARELRYDYTSVEYDGDDYLTRSC